MKASTVVGIFLVLVGLAAFMYPRLSVTHEKKILDAGPIEVTRKDQHTLALPPIAGGIALLGGIILIATGTRKN